MELLELFNALKNSFLGNNSFFYIRNILEVLFFTTIIYYFSIWLKKDTKKNLLLSFYSYCSILLLAYYFELTTISYFMFLFCPVAIMLFIIFHQTTLQKNFVAMKNKAPSKQESKNWPQELVRSFLFAINNNKQILCAVERSDSLKEFINSKSFLNADIEHDFVNILHASASFDQNKIFWINTNGQIKAINSLWNQDIFENIKNQDQNFGLSQLRKAGLSAFPNSPQELKEREEVAVFRQNATILTAKTDSIFFYLTPQNRTFTVIFKGEIFNNINSDSMINILAKHAFYKFNESDPKKMKGEFFNEHAKKDIFKQRSN